MSLKKTIENLVKTTEKSNAEIHEFLIDSGMPCTKRTVRRYANPIRARLTGETKEDLPKILLFDIETAPMEVFVWSLWQKYIGKEAIIKDISILSWAAKWLFDPTMMSESVAAEEAANRKDGSVLASIWKLLDAADIVIAHNGAKFDARILNTRFALAGYKPPMPYRMIDTLRVARQNFQLSSYSLDYINRLFSLTPKRETNFELWRRCVGGDEHALNEMREYNEIDVVALEECYLELRPWIKSHPNVALFISTDKEVCTNCGSADLEWRGNYYTPAGRFKAFRCLNPKCGAIGRSRYSDLTTEERKRLHLSIAR